MNSSPGLTLRCLATFSSEYRLFFKLLANIITMSHFHIIIEQPKQASWEALTG